MSDYYGDFRNGTTFIRIQNQLKVLEEQLHTLPPDDPAALELRLKIGALQGQLEAEFYPGDTQDWWCVWCGRVSVQPTPLDGIPHCRYEDCDPLERLQALMCAQYTDTVPGAHFEYTLGERWSGVREDYHPGYPETAVQGKLYLVPEIPVELVRFTRPSRA